MLLAPKRAALGLKAHEQRPHVRRRSERRLLAGARQRDNISVERLVGAGVFHARVGRQSKEQFPARNRTRAPRDCPDHHGVLEYGLGMVQRADRPRGERGCR